MTILAVLVSSLFISACSENVTAPIQIPITENNPPIKRDAKDFPEFVDQLKQKALTQGISQSVIDNAFRDVYFLSRVVSADKNQLEKKITLDEYLKRVLSDNKRRESAEMYLKHAEQLSKVSEKYAVQSNYIVALWGLESSFGRVQGKESVISALATLAFDGRRETFFTNELMAALQILQRGYIGTDKLKGSWAGAMGQSQFMPTSYLKYGADGNDDGVIDIWYDTDDVFASTANYLATEGWQKDQRWGNEVTVPADLDISLTGVGENKAKSIAEWQQLAITFNSPYPQPPASQRAWLILPDDNQGRAFLVYDNFRSIMHWNRSYYFAISVGMLADSLTDNEFSGQFIKQQ